MADGRTEDGFGIEFGVNHLGHFLLTCLLLERLKELGGGRVVTLASMAYRWGHIDFEVSVFSNDGQKHPLITCTQVLFVDVTVSVAPPTNY